MSDNGYSYCVVSKLIFWDRVILDDSDEVVVAISGANAPVVFNILIKS